MLGLLSRDLLWRFLVSFAAVLLVLVLAMAVIDLLGDFEDIVNSSDGFLGALTYVALRIPAQWLPLLVPVAAFVAAFLALGTAARALEFVAIKASGVSPLRVLTPVLAAGLLISGLGLVVNETVAIRAHDAWRRHTGGDHQVEFRRGSFWYHKGRYVYNVRDADPQARELRDVAIFQLDARGRLLRSIHAASASVDADGHWQLADAVIRRFEPGSPEAPIAFERMPRTELVLTDEVALFEAGVQGLSIRDLREYRNGRPADDPEASRATALLHDRLTKPLAAVVFVLLAIPLGMRVEQTRSLAVPALQGIVLLFSFSTVREYGVTLASQGVTEPALTPWAILLAFTLGGAGLLWRTPR